MALSREALVCKAFDEAQQDPEWLKLKAERDEKIRAIEDIYHRKWLKIRGKYWEKYGIWPRRSGKAE